MTGLPMKSPLLLNYHFNAKKLLAICPPGTGSSFNNSLLRILHVWNGAIEASRFNFPWQNLGSIRQGHNQHFFCVYRTGPIIEAEFVIFPQNYSFRGASIFTVTAEDAAHHINLVGTSITFAWRVTFFVGIFGRFDKDRIRRASRRTQ